MNIKELFSYHPKQYYNFELKPIGNTLQNYEPSPKQNVSSNIELNLKYIQSKYQTSINSDIMIRTFNLIAQNRTYKAFLVYIDGMVDSKLINDFVLEPLMLRSYSNTYTKNIYQLTSENKNNISVKKITKFNLENYIYDSLIPQNNLTKKVELNKIVESANSGNCALFIDTLEIAFDIDIKGFKQRSVDTPQNENIINGPQEAFVENIRVNTSLLRRILNNENLIIESMQVGEISKTQVAVCYMQNIINPELIKEIKYRINNLKLDSLISSGQLAQLIEENEKIDIPTLLETERPDKCSKFLMQGRAVILVNGNPYAIIAPAVLIDFLASPEDTNLKTLFANFLKVLRILAYFITLLAPGMFIAITGFHHEILPTELLFSILASRENVPFPIIFELILMEISFELIRESGIRVPAPIGATLGIVGALILGDAAVSAHIVSPILIIIVAITGLSSFAIPDFAFSFHLRVYRFLFTLLGFCAGFIGIGAGLLVYINMLCSMNSFGVSFVSPLTSSLSTHFNSFFVKPAWKFEKRPGFIQPKKKYAQPKISKKWRY